MNNGDNINPNLIIYHYLGVILRHWRLIIFTSFFICSITIIHVLFLPKKYTSEAVIIPSNYTQIPRGRLRIFAAQLGLSNDNISNLDQPDIFKIICKSRDVIHLMIQEKYITSDDSNPRKLNEILNIDSDSLIGNDVSYLLYEILVGMIKVWIDPKTQVIRLQCVSKDPVLSAELVKGLLNAVQMFNRQVRINKAVNNKKFIEQRLEETDSALKSAENKLKEFRDKNRSVTHSPGLQLELGRLIREQKIQEEVFLTLSREYELAKIQEIKEQPVIDVLESPSVPKVKSAPQRRKIVMMAGIISVFIGILLSFMKEYLLKCNIKETFKKIYNS